MLCSDQEKRNKRTAHIVPLRHARKRPSSLRTRALVGSAWEPRIPNAVLTSSSPRTTAIAKCPRNLPGLRTFHQEHSSKTPAMSTNGTHYTIRPTSESSVAVQVFKVGLMAGRKHTLFVEHYSGLVEYDSEHPEKSRVEIFFDANSVVSRDEWLNSEKRGQLVAFVQNEILAVDRHAQIAFSSGRVERKSSTRFELEGTLSIRGSSRQVACEAVVLTHGKDRLEVDGTARIKLSDFEIDRPSACFGLIRTKDEVNLRFLLWPERAAAAEKKFKAVSG